MLYKAKLLEILNSDSTVEEKAADLNAILVRKDKAALLLTQSTKALTQVENEASVTVLKANVESLTAQLNHEKANKDHLVQVNAFLRQRPDLPVDRIPAILLFEEAKEKISSYEQSLIAIRQRCETELLAFDYQSASANCSGALRDIKELIDTLKMSTTKNS